MTFTTLFIDLDDTVYPATSGVWELIKQRISLYMHERLALSWEVIPSQRSYYYQNFGTTMRGLVADYNIDTQDYLDFVHDVQLDHRLEANHALRTLLQGMPQKKLIFTNADAAHARRVLNALQLSDCFDDIIDIFALTPFCKPQPMAFQRALELSGESEAQRCVFFDDADANLKTAKELGFFTVKIGSENPSECCHAAITRLEEFCKVIPC